MTDQRTDLDRGLLERIGARELGSTAAGYPRRLARLVDPPAAIYLRGTLPEGRAVAIVGARAARLEATERARELSAGLAREGIAVVSGGAIGVDAAAHAGALEGDGATVAVLGSGIDRPYPERNLELFERIARAGALLTEQVPGTPPRRQNFPRRNRLIAALADAVVVVEAGPRSGALHTASWARWLGVPLLALDGSPGARALLRRGWAGELRVVEDLLAVLAGATPRRARLEPEHPDARAALEELRRLGGEAALDPLARRLGWRPARVAAALLRLELEGLARATAGGYLAEPEGRHEELE